MLLAASFLVIKTGHAHFVYISCAYIGSQVLQDRVPRKVANVFLFFCTYHYIYALGFIRGHLSEVLDAQGCLSSVHIFNVIFCTGKSALPLLRLLLLQGMHKVI